MKIRNLEGNGKLGWKSMGDKHTDRKTASEYNSKTKDLT